MNELDKELNIRIFDYIKDNLVLEAIPHCDKSVRIRIKLEGVVISESEIVVSHGS